MSNFTNITSLTGLLTSADAVVGDGLLIFSLEVSVWVVFLLATMGYGKWRALTYSSFMTGVLMLMLNIGGLAEYWHITLAGVAFAIGFFMMIVNKNTVGN